MWFGQIAGAALIRDRLYVFDSETDHVLVFDDRLTSVADSFGDRGQGPGEFPEISPIHEYGPPRWLMPGGQGELIVFDGSRLQRFGADGSYMGLAMSTQAVGEAGLNPDTPKFGWAHDSLYIFTGGYDAFSMASIPSASRGSNPAFYGRVEVRGRRRDLMVVPLPRLPQGPVGPRQARPFWAVGPRCLWATDGSRPVFYRVRSDGSGRDSMVLHLHLPNPPAEQDADAAHLLRRVGGNGSFPKPTALWRVRDLLFDPAGRLWIRLNPLRSPDSSVAVAVLDPESGETVGVHVPEFPLAFGAPGVFYAATRDSLDRQLIGRYALTGAPPHS